MRQMRSFEALRGHSLQARDGEIGKIVQMYFDDETWGMRYVVVRTGWLLGREVLIAPRSITGLDEPNLHIAVDLTREQVENSPPLDTQKPVSRHYESEFYRYYDWVPYWTDDPLGLPMMAKHVPPPEHSPTRMPEHPHLRASEEVHGYEIHASDGDLGEVDDFIIDDHEWKIRYFVVDTRKWLPGKKVLIAPAWVERLSWEQSALVVGLKRETIQSAPSYDPAQLISRDYEVRLYSHYGKAMQEETGVKSA